MDTPTCAVRASTYKSCLNRHGTKCQALSQARWLDRPMACLLLVSQLLFDDETIQLPAAPERTVEGEPSTELVSHRRLAWRNLSTRLDRP